MDTKELRALMEAYQQVYAPIDEAITSEKGKAKAAAMIAARSTPSGRAKSGQGDTVAQIKHISRSDKEGLGGTPATRSTSGKNYPKSYTGTGGTGNKAARRAGLTPTREKPNAWKEEVDIFDVVLEFLQAEGYAETLEEAEWLMANVINEEAIDIILGEALTGERYKKVMKKPGGTAYSRKVSADPSKRATRGGRGGESDFGAGDRGSGNKAARRAGTYQEYQEEYMDEAQAARENPEKYEAGEKKKYAPVRGERTPMPPRGDKRREDFEKWYRANVR